MFFLGCCICTTYGVMVRIFVLKVDVYRDA